VLASQTSSGFYCTRQKIVQNGYNIKRGTKVSISADKKVADITLSEMKKLIREVILEVIDPDYGLELRDETVEALRQSFEEKERGKGIPLQEAKNRLGVK